MKSGIGGEPMKVRCFGLQTTGKVLVRYLSWTGLVVFIEDCSEEVYENPRRRFGFYGPHHLCEITEMPSAFPDRLGETSDSPMTLYSSMLVSIHRIFLDSEDQSETRWESCVRKSKAT